MSAEALTATMEKLLKLHKSLYELAVKKTDIIKTGDMDGLNQMLKDEQAHIAAISRLENEREKAANSIVPMLESPTVSDCLNILTQPDRLKLEAITKELAELVYELKEQNFLNQQLVHHSLQFINVSMNLLRPQPESMNYGPPANKKSEKMNPGIFNSKV
ncbi:MULTISPECIES: flagellar protein FlgN [Cytobacillus]|uniref:flagellar protein FlgN n=1 Tax=Cytobacillus TaxID=2675230 RepID=UPI00203FCE76|nr:MULTISPECIES: flagellar protein FlgN [Cytobacillus]MCM3391458.1 flagellar protein FlgN [Cytobacillus oceanisediminis]UQX53826.1 flagellar protein FlgN [Cytobacillus pseudoceanisediminis]